MSEQTKINDGGPAFPQGKLMHVNDRDANGLPSRRIETIQEGGMSLLDYFAARAMPVVIRDQCDSDPCHREHAAIVSYEFARAMLEHRDELKRFTESE